MKSCVAFFVVVVVAHAKPSGVAAPLLTPVVPAVAVSAPIFTQYHTQSELGEYSYGYSNPLSSKAEVKSLDGITRGAYNYVDATGQLQSVEYSSDALNGFRVAASNLPVAPAVPVYPPLVVPEAVKDTPDVVEARARHLDALKEAEERTAEQPAAVVTKTETVVPALRLAEAGVAVAPTFANFAVLPGVIPTPTVRLGSPIVSYNYGIPGAAVSYAAYAAPGFIAYTTQVTPAAGDIETVEVEAKAAKLEAKEKSD